MGFLEIFILSIVEGITEFLPISSTAHLILTSNILGLARSEFLSTFEIAIQLGAILAVLFFSYKKILSQKDLLIKACIGFIPTGIIGLALYKYIKGFFADPIVPVVSLFVGGIAIIGIEIIFKNKSKNKKPQQFKILESLNYKDALLIGLLQAISIIPGVSRAAASIFGGMVLKYDRKSAVEFSFILAIPTMIAATIFDLAKSASNFSTNEITSLFTGVICSFFVALFVIKWLIKYVQKNDFILFGIYRIILAIAYFYIFLF